MSHPISLLHPMIAFHSNRLYRPSRAIPYCNILRVLQLYRSRIAVGTPTVVPCILLVPHFRIIAPTRAPVHAQLRRSGCRLLLVVSINRISMLTRTQDRTISHIHTCSSVACASGSSCRLGESMLSCCVCIVRRA
jgi:hypothetical protein